MISYWKSRRNKKFETIAPISLFLLIGAFFDIMIFVFQRDNNSSRILAASYWIIIPINILFANKIVRINFIIILPFLLFLSFFLIHYFDYNYFINNIDFISYPFIFLMIASIFSTIHNCFKYKKKLTAINYFYYLILCSLILDLFFFLGYYQIITFENTVWVLFFKFYLIYLNFIRAIYIFYVAKNI